MGAIAVCDLIKTTLGPKGMDKILRSMTDPDGAIKVTNDGATILSEIHVDNPAARILINISQTQDSEVGDGTTTVAVLAGELLREAEKLVHTKIHPQTILEGFKIAKDVAMNKLKSLAMNHSENEELFKRDLLNIAKTTLSSKLVFHEKEFFAKLCVDAVLRLKGSTNLEYIKIIKKPGGCLSDSFLDEGFLLEKSISVGSAKTVEDCRVLIANTPMDYDKIKIFGSKVKVDSIDKVAEIEVAEKVKMREKVDKILAYKPTVFVNRQLIYNYPEQLMVEKGVTVIEHADFDGTERLARVLGADIMSTFDTPEEGKLGRCKLLSEVMIGEDSLIKFSGCAAGEACSLVLRGSGSHILDEAERSIHDALCVLSQTVLNSKVTYGGGNTEISMALAVEEKAKTISGKEALAVEGFARALRQLPTIIADNAGLDSADLVQKLRSQIHGGNASAGLDINKACIGDMKELGIMVYIYIYI